MVRETKADLVRRAAFQVGLLCAAHRICKRKMLKRTQIACAGYLFLHLYDYATREPIPKAPTLNYTLANIGEEYCLSVARFYPSDLRRIMQHLHLADSYTTPERIVYDTGDAFLLLCWRLAGLEKYQTFISHFTWNDETTCKLIVRHLISVLVPLILPILRGGSPLFGVVHIEQCAQIVSHLWGLTYAIIFGFVDTKLFKTCRPVKFQRSIFNGGKHRAHGMNGQSVIDPFGLNLHFYCPVSGRRHDAEVFDQSRVYELLQELLQERVKCLFGDSAYRASNRLIPMVKNPHTDAERERNRFQAALRICVEHGLNKIVTLWPLLDVKRRMRVMLSPVASLINVAAFLTNCHTLLYGSQVCDYFECRHLMPDLADYFPL